MLDKIIYKKQNEVCHEFILIYSFRSPFTLTANSFLELNQLLDEFLAPIQSQENFKTLTQYNAALQASSEDTVILFQDDAA